jgi:prepilin-type N-terminal cleavage/methylation domain-containing protein
MRTSGKFRSTRQGFTLVELLTVIVIIGILAGLITGAAIMARNTVKQKVVLTEIAQFDIGLKKYHTEFGEYPPDFTSVAHTNVAIRAAAQQEVIRHLRHRFPKYRPVGNPAAPAASDWAKFCFDVSNNYPVNPSTFDAASALTFWLGGLPETVPAAGDPWRPSGFHSDPKFPFRLGLPRTDTFYDFEPDRLARVGTEVQYYPSGGGEFPLVYFKAIKSPVNGRYEYGRVDIATATLFPVFYQHAAGNVAVPYLSLKPKTPAPGDVTQVSAATATRQWESLDTYQIVWCGFDEEYGIGSPAALTLDFFRVTQTGQNFDPNGADYDNLTSVFAGKLEDAIE